MELKMLIEQMREQIQNIEDWSVATCAVRKEEW